MHALALYEIHAELHRTGWCLSEIPYVLRGRSIRQVDARRGEKWIIAREFTQTVP